MIRVVVAEDSPTTRKFLVTVLDDDSAIEVVGEAADGKAAVELACDLRPDVVVMDIEMPRLDGYGATRHIMNRVPTPIVMVSGHTESLESRAIEALAAGALVLIGKPSAVGEPCEVQRLVETVKLMAEVRVVRRWTHQPHVDVPSRTPQARRPVRVVAIGASAGGPAVVVEILEALPRPFPSPILLVQHIAYGFAAPLADWLERTTGMTVRLAVAGERATAGVVHVAPDDVQMEIDPGGRLRLTDGPAADGFRPSASHLLRSVARSCGAFAAGVLLTGMGRDGARGLLELRERGGVTIAQDKDSSVVFGMPGEAIRIGAAEYVLPPRRIAEVLAELTSDIRHARRRVHP